MLGLNSLHLPEEGDSWQEGGVDENVDLQQFTFFKGTVQRDGSGQK
jgi:hypothetical protein